MAERSGASHNQWRFSSSHFQGLRFDPSFCCLFSSNWQKFRVIRKKTVYVANVCKNCFVNFRMIKVKVLGGPVHLQSMLYLGHGRPASVYACAGLM